jgi:hypothetical protein
MAETSSEHGRGLTGRPGASAALGLGVDEVGGSGEALVRSAA